MGAWPRRRQRGFSRGCSGGRSCPRSWPWASSACSRTRSRAGRSRTSLGRRLATAAAGAAATVLPEQLEAFGAGDEGSLTYGNVRRKLEAARERLGVRRVMAVAGDLTGRGDTAGRLALGAAAYELGADRAEIERARGGVPTASPLFVGHDGVPYKRAYAAVGEPGAIAGLIAVEGSADYYVTLAVFRRRLLLAGGLALLAVLALTALVARRISGPVAVVCRSSPRGSGAASSRRASPSRRATRSGSSRRRSTRRAPRCTRATSASR